MSEPITLVELAHRERVITELRMLLDALRVLLDEITALPEDDPEVVTIKLLLYQRMRMVQNIVQRVFNAYRAQ